MLHLRRELLILSTTGVSSYFGAE